MEQLAIRVAEISINLLLDHLATESCTHLLEHYQAFIADPDPNALSICLRTEPGPEFIPVKPGPIQIRTSEQDGRIDFESYHERGFVNREENKGELILRPQGDPENFLRVLYAWMCLDQSALLIHAAGIIRHNCGYIFFGHSGSGKTTLSRLSLDQTVLSDDLVIIKKRSGAAQLFGVPFRGDFPEAPRTNATAELCGIFALDKDNRHYLVPLSGAESVARLASCIPFVMTNAHNAQRVSGICEEIARQVPPYNLHFARDTGFWEVIDGLD